MAVTTTNPNSGELTYFSIPIAKTDNTDEINPVDGTPDLIIWGKATDGTVDGDLQIVDPGWSGPAIRKWLETGGNVRASHDPHQEVGRGLEVELSPDGHWVKSLIVDPVAKHKIRNKVLNDYSVGIAFPMIEQDPTGKALNGIIKGGQHTQICEISVVGRGSNYNSRFQLVKSAPDGMAQFTGKMIEGAPPQVAPRQIALTSDLVTVELPKDFTIKVTPKDIAKLVNARKRDKIEKREFDRGVGAHGVDRDSLPESDFADPANRKYPIVVPKDVKDAWGLAHNAGANEDAVRKRIRSIAHRKGPSFVAAIPDTANEDKEKSYGQVTSPEGHRADQPTGDRAGAAQTDPGHVHKEDVHADGAHREDSEQGVLGQQPGHDAVELRVTKSDDDNDDKGRTHAAENFDSDAEASGGDSVQAEDATNDESEGDNDNEGYSSPARAKKVKAKKNKKKGKGKKAMKTLEPDLAKEAGRTKPTPGDGVVAAHTEPVPKHREPDGDAIEAFEADAKLPTDPDSEYKTVLRNRTIGAPDDVAQLHDQLCPGFHPASIKQAYPLAEQGDFDITPWQQLATDAWAMSTVEEAEKADGLLAGALLVKGCHPAQLEQMQGELFKEFRDANGSPSSFPTPHEPMAGQFKRPPQTAGRARLSHQYEGPNTSSLSFDHVAPNDFDRGFLDGGRAADSPANDGSSRPVSPPDRPGKPTRVFYTGAQRENAKQAMRAMHDHIAGMFPDMCPMSPHDDDLTDVPSPNHGVSAVGLPATKEAPVNIDELAVKISSSVMSVDEIRDALALAVKGAKGGKKKGKKGKLPSFIQDKIDAKKDGDDADGKKDGSEKAASAPAPAAETAVETPSVTKAAVVTGESELELLLKAAVPDMVTKAVTVATAELTKAAKALAKQNKELSAQNKDLGARLADLEGQANPNFRYYRGLGPADAVLSHIAKSSAARDAVPPTASGVRDGAQMQALQLLNEQFMETASPWEREAALGKIYEMTGIRH